LAPEKKTFASAGIQTLDHTAHSLVTTLTELLLVQICNNSHINTKIKTVRRQKYTAFILPNFGTTRYRTGLVIILKQTLNIR
jgi:glucuronate isomerase